MEKLEKSSLFHSWLDYYPSFRPEILTKPWRNFTKSVNVFCSSEIWFWILFVSCFKYVFVSFFSLCLYVVSYFLTFYLICYHLCLFLFFSHWAVAHQYNHSPIFITCPGLIPLTFSLIIVKSCVIVVSCWFFSYLNIINLFFTIKFTYMILSVS